MKAYRIEGRFRMGRGWQRFSKEVAAPDEAAAKEYLLSVLGSQHRVGRRYVEIHKVAEVPPAELRSHAVKYALEVRG